MGDHLKNPHLEEEEEEEEEEEGAEEAEEALSLCDLPLKPNNEDEDNKAGLEEYSSNHTPRSRSETPDFFEFFSDFSSEMCPADDIFFCGKLIAIKEEYFPTTLASHQIPKASTSTEELSQTNKTIFRRRSDSLSKLQRPVTRSNSGSNPELMRNSRSLDYKKLHRSSNSMISTAPEIEKNSSAKGVQGKSDTVLKKAGKPRRYFFMFGMVKFPPEMELSDIKNRQVRNNPPSTLFPVNQSSGKGSWRLLKALSCKDHASVAVTASFCIPHT